MWTTPLPSTTPVWAPGAHQGRLIADQVRRYYGHASLNTTAFAPHVYVVDGNQPRVAVKADNCTGKPKVDPGFVAQMQSVPVPAGMLVPTDSDAHIVIWQPSTDTIWEFWKARRRANGWSACWGGRLDRASRSGGTFPFPYGGTASGLALLGGVVRLEELQRGEIKHAIAISLPEVRKGVYSWPANRTDGRSTSPGAIAEGQRFRLDPTINVANLGLPPITRMIARAMQRYGVIVRDGAGSVALYTESATPFLAAGGPDPFVAYYGGTPKWALLDGIPWDRLIALPFDYGKPR